MEKERTLEILEKLPSQFITKWFTAEEIYEALDEALEAVEKKRPTGHWIDHTDEECSGTLECPFCHHEATCDDNMGELRYCSYCGAELEGR